MIIIPAMLFMQDSGEAQRQPSGFLFVFVLTPLFQLKNQVMQDFFPNWTTSLKISWQIQIDTISAGFTGNLGNHNELE